MSKEWFIKEGGQVCFKSDNAELNDWDIQSLVDCLNGKEIKISDLEAKLADKDEESLKYFNEYRAWKSKCELLEQDQISFALEQLEKVKELINNKLEFMWQNNAEMTCRDRHIIEKCYEDIDELITEIKEMK